MKTDWDTLRKEYGETGYTVARDLLPRASISQALQDINALFSSQLNRFKLEAIPFEGPESTFANIKRVFDTDIDAYLGTIRRAAKLVSLQKLLLRDELLEGIKNISSIYQPAVPTEPVVHIMSDELRVPNGYFGLGAHQDWPSIQGSLDVVITWVPLVPVSSKNYPVEVIPQSHKQGLIPGQVSNNEWLISESSYDEEAFVRVDVDPGDVIFFTGFTLHKTALEGCEGFRIAASTRYENTEEVNFVHRNFPCAYKRTVQRELITPNFPSREEVLNALS